MWLARSRWALPALATTLALGCGSRTSLLEDEGDVVVDAGEGDDGPVAADAGGADAIGTGDAAKDGAVRDAGADVLVDAAHDAAHDAGHDAGPPPACTATTTTLLADAAYGIDQIEVDDSGVYFHDSKGIWRVPKTGGATTALASIQPPSWPNVDSFVMDDTSLTWLQIFNGKSTTEVRRAPKSGGATTTLASLGDYFYFIEPGGIPGVIDTWTGASSDRTLHAVDSNGTVSTVMSSLPISTTSLVHDGADIYMTALGTVVRWDGASFHTVASTQRYTGLLVQDATTLFFAEADGLGNVDIASVPKTGGTPKTVFVPTKGFLGGFTLDATHLYVVDRLVPSVVRMNKDGTGATTIASVPALEQILDVAVDGRCLYFTATSAGVIQTSVYATPK